MLPELFFFSINREFSIPFLKRTLSPCCPSNKLVISVAMWHVAPSCRNYVMLMIKSCIFRNRNVLSMCQCRTIFTVTEDPSSFRKKYGPMMAVPCTLHQTVNFNGCNGISIYCLVLVSLHTYPSQNE